MHTVRPNVDSDDLGFGCRIDLAAKADATPCVPCTPERLPSRRRDPGELQCRQGVLKRKPTPGLIRGGLASRKRVKPKIWSPVSIPSRRKKALGMIQQVEVRQQLHGEIATKRSVAVAAITTDSGHLDRALIELDVVDLVSLGG